MPDPKPDVLEFLLMRRSLPARSLTAPAPPRHTVELMLRAAARAPDHGKLEPWRFIVLAPPACARLAALAETRGEALGHAPEKRAKARELFAGAPLIVAVIAAPVPSDKIPEAEQTLSTGAVCVNLLNAAQAAGYGANWLSGWMAFDRPFLDRGLGLAGHEFVAGFVHLGSATATPPDRPRPDVPTLTTWMPK